MTFAIKFEPSGRLATLTYIEAERCLSVELEMSGAAEFDWVAVDQSFRAWTQPQGVPIEMAHQAEIKTRLVDWLQSRGMRLGIHPGVGVEAVLDRMRAAGWSVEPTADGFRLSPPESRGGA
jgi:hypothetical protein